MSNTTSVNSELFAPLVTAAQFAAYEQSVARQMMTVFDAPVNAGKVLQVPVWSAVSAETIGDESAATAADTNTTSASITLSEHVVFHKVTDMLRDSAYGNVMNQAFAEFTNLGGATTAIALAAFGKDDIMDRVADLRANKLTGPFYAVIHPKAANAIKKSLTASDNYAASGSVADNILANYFVGQLAGCRIIESALVPYAEGTGVATCAVTMEEQRQAAGRATDVVLTGVAGASVLQSAHGFIMNVDLVA